MAENKVAYEGTVVYHGFKNRTVGTLEFTFEGCLMAFRIYNAKSKEKIDAEDFGKKHLNNSENLKK